jgi:hypothetical protein
MENPVWVQIRLRGYALGMKTNLPRAEELINSSLGQSMHVVVDGRPYFPKINTPLDIFNQSDSYYETMYKFDIPFSLESGRHLLQVFPARSYGESLKGEGCFYSQYFYVKNKTENEKIANLQGPYLIYNEPGVHHRYPENKPILLDFYVRNLTLPADGYRVHVFLDEQPLDFLGRWLPYYLVGVKKGTHSLRLQLVDKKGAPLIGNFTTVEGHFTVE